MGQRDGIRKDVSTVATMPSDEARGSFGALLDRVIGGERILITRNGRPSALLTAASDLARLDGEAA